MVSLCLGLKIGLGHFLNIDIMTLVLGFELDWLVLLKVHTHVKNVERGRPMYLIKTWIGLFLGCHLMSK